MLLYLPLPATPGALPQICSTGSSQIYDVMHLFVAGGALWINGYLCTSHLTCPMSDLWYRWDGTTFSADTLGIPDLPSFWWFGGGTTTVSNGSSSVWFTDTMGNLFMFDGVSPPTSANMSSTTGSIWNLDAAIVGMSPSTTTLYFAAFDSLTGNELWGCRPGTLPALVANLVTDSGGTVSSSDPRSLTAFAGGRWLAFTCFFGNKGVELCLLSAASGATSVVDVGGGSASGYPTDYVPYGADRLFFLYSKSGVSGFAVGMHVAGSGTFTALGIPSGSVAQPPTALLAGCPIFVHFDNTRGRQLGIFNTSDGWNMAVSFFQAVSALDSQPSDLYTVSSGTQVFVSAIGSGGRELFSITAAASGVTLLQHELNTARDDSSSPGRMLSLSNDTLLVSSTTVMAGREFSVVNLTSRTATVLDANAGGSSYPGIPHLSVIDGNVWWPSVGIATDGLYSYDLAWWRPGTTAVSPDPINMANSASYRAISASDAVQAPNGEIWMSASVRGAQGANSVQQLPFNLFVRCCVSVDAWMPPSRFFFPFVPFTSAPSCAGRKQQSLRAVSYRRTVRYALLCWIQGVRQSLLVVATLLLSLPR